MVIASPETEGVKMQKDVSGECAGSGWGGGRAHRLQGEVVGDGVARSGALLDVRQAHGADVGAVGAPPGGQHPGGVGAALHDHPHAVHQLHQVVLLVLPQPAPPPRRSMLNTNF